MRASCQDFACLSPRLPIWKWMLVTISVYSTGLCQMLSVGAVGMLRAVFGFPMIYLLGTKIGSKIPLLSRPANQSNQFPHSPCLWLCKHCSAQGNRPLPAFARKGNPVTLLAYHHLAGSGQQNVCCGLETVQTGVEGNEAREPGVGKSRWPRVCHLRFRSWS